MSKLVEAVERMALRIEDGHFTVLSFTTNYRGCFGTPAPQDLMHGGAFYGLPAHGSFRELLEGMLAQPGLYKLP